MKLDPEHRPAEAQVIKNIAVVGLPLKVAVTRGRIKVFKSVAYTEQRL